MILRNSLNFISQFFSSTSKQIRKIYINSNYYDKKISKVSINKIKKKYSLSNFNEYILVVFHPVTEDLIELVPVRAQLPL